MEHNFIEDNIIILSKQTLDLFLFQDKIPPKDIISVYVFYYYTAKWQKTNQIKATSEFVKNGIKIGSDKLKIVNKFLKENKLISKIITRNEKGEATGHFIRLNYLWKKENEDTAKTLLSRQTPMDVTTILPTTCGYQETNALSANNINALSASSVSNETPLNPLEHVPLPIEHGNDKYNIISPKKKFVPPTQKEVMQQMYLFSTEKGLNLNEEQLTFEADKFSSHHETKNWMIGKVKMSSWKGAIRYWMTTGYGDPSKKKTQYPDLSKE